MVMRSSVRTLRKKVGNAHAISVEMRKSKLERVHQYVPVIISVASVALNFFIVYFTAWPRYDLELLSPTMCFDPRAVADEAFLDSTYVRFTVYNSGNRSVSLYDINFNISDPQDTTLGIVRERVQIPSLIAPGEIATCILRLKVFRNWTRQSSKPWFYSVPRSASYDDWLSIVKSTNVLVSFPLSHSIILKVIVNYTGHNVTIESPISALVPLH